MRGEKKGVFRDCIVDDGGGEGRLDYDKDGGDRGVMMTTLVVVIVVKEKVVGGNGQVEF